ncbi:MAG: cupin domain-containing protein [Thermodesulfobacteriota bacterium]|nr:cupin domain-containing protein [Thermodesulfobacteriota bacterium]
MLQGNQKEVKPEAAPMPGAKGAYIQWLIAGPQGAKNFFMRRISIKEGGLVPEHEHPEEHEIFALSGQGRVQAGGRTTMMNPGDFFFIPGGQRHGFTNIGSGELVFICCINVPRE